jgi:hypothetical protein
MSDRREDSEDKFDEKILRDAPEAESLPAPAVGRFVVALEPPNIDGVAEWERLNAEWERLIAEGKSLAELDIESIDLPRLPQLEHLAIVWRNARGEEVLHQTDGYLLMGCQEEATWLPEGWRMDVFPVGWTLPHLERWFTYAFTIVEEVNADERFDIPPGSDRSPTYAPTPRGLVAHAHLIVRHLGLPDSPTEPRGPMDRLGCLAELRDLLGFFRRALKPGATTRDPGPSPLTSDAEAARSDEPGRKGKGINEKMLAKLQADQECLGWSVRDWAEHLGCSISTVQGTKAWITIKKARALQAAERVTRQKKASQRPRRRRPRRS